MTIEFTPLTVLIGENSCGKTTILQALDFLRSAATRDIPEYLNGKRWHIFDLKSQFNEGRKNPIEFIATYIFTQNDKIINLEWFFSVNCLSVAQKEWFIQEKITDKETDKVLLSHGFNDMNNCISPMTAGSSNAYAGSPAAVARELSFDLLKLETSALKVASAALVKDPEKVFALKNFLAASKNFDMLSPERMRDGNERKNTDDIGASGESLAVYIHNMDNDQKAELEKIVSEIIGFGIKIHTENVDGKYIIHTIQFFANGVTDTTAAHISDGLLRIIAFAAIMQRTKTIELAISNGDIPVGQLGSVVFTGREELQNGMILIDEIENGINPYLTEKVIGLFKTVVENTSRQVIVTTHSPVILNDISPEEIVFLWKDKNGSVHSRKFFDTEEMREALDFLNPGEIWENYGKDTILTKLGVSPEDR